ncbi:MAG: hypothetical protein UT24_C0016G0048 [Candidatus Woesebacteria bacterium GW2011_GWB1_39_12]|uniref:Uncharacterized protein n=1 Tax=Candidatus Woesebacteria bacterium GW2011_GWB1_39_12 TaxID=1618574 RepID=A0A0G0M7R2_9BACT|nr:MAG: hypothetical protein UT24_C0016G0048 [Candidatus Woesebacteria bacterium GW2011_GWB1_39_12]
MKNSKSIDKGKKKQISHINNDWFWASSVGQDSIEITPLKWWERILYWKFPDKSYKSK